MADTWVVKFRWYGDDREWWEIDGAFLYAMKGGEDVIGDLNQMALMEEQENLDVITNIYAVNERKPDEIRLAFRTDAEAQARLTELYKLAGVDVQTMISEDTSGFVYDDEIPF